MNPSDYVVAGYFLALPEQRHEGFNDPDLIPPEVFSASCHATTLPSDAWIEWCGASEEERRAAAVDRGVAIERIPAIVRWTTDHFDGDVRFANLCATRDAVARLRAVVGPADPRLAEIGLALPQSELERFLRVASPAQRPGFAPVGRSGAATGVAEGVPPAAGGVVLGHEPITCEGGGLSCSWLCTASEKGVHEALGIRTNANGLIESVDDAVRACAWIDEDISRGEPGPWFPWLLIRYDR